MRPASDSSGAGRTFSAREVEAWPKRADAEAALGVSKSTVRRLEASGVLVAIRDEAGVTRIEPESLARAVGQLGGTSPNTSDASLRRSDVADGVEVEMSSPCTPERHVTASREPEIFAALAAGHSPVQVVVELGVSAPEVEAAMASWTRLMTPWEPPGSVVIEHVEALTACVHELHLCVGVLEGRLAQLEHQLGSLVDAARGASSPR